MRAPVAHPSHAPAEQSVRWRCLRLNETGMKAPAVPSSPVPGFPLPRPPLVPPGTSQDRAPGGGPGPVPLRRRPGPAVPLAASVRGQGPDATPPRGQGPVCHPTPIAIRPLPFSGRPMACQQARADVRPSSARVPAAPPRTGGGCLAAEPAGCSPAPLSSFLRVYEEQARLTPTTFSRIFLEILRRLVPASGEGPFPQVDDWTRRPAGSLPLSARYQLPRWAGSSPRRVMTASGTTPSCGGTSLCGISTPRMPRRLAP